MIQKAAVIGHPIGHSLSPLIFGVLAKETGCSGLLYEAQSVRPEELQGFLQKLRQEPEWLGVNVTIPHKEAILSLVDDKTEAVKFLGAGNVISVRSGKLQAHNTDVKGIEDTLGKEKVDVRVRNVIILGAGGAARATAWTVAQLGARQICIFNRSEGRAKKLISDLSSHFSKTKWLQVSEVDQIPFSNLDLIVQTTPLGMSGHGSSQEALNLFTEIFQRSCAGTIAFDLVYRPERTPFVELAEKKAYQNFSGLSMLIGQALATWEIWLGPLQNRNDLFEKLTGALRQHLEKSK